MNMNRLTIKDADGDIGLNCNECSNDGSTNCGFENCYTTAMCRLAAFEDILGEEYDLDRLRELVAADREGRCVVSPCKVGDYAHFLVPDLIDGGIDVEKIMVSEVGSKGFWVSKYTAKPHEMHDFTPWEELGVSVFLTREEAEAVLRKREASQ